MPFAGRGTAPAGPPAGAPPPNQPSAPPPPQGGPPPPPPPPSQPSATPPAQQPPNVMVYVNNNTDQAYPLANLMNTPPSTPAWCEGMAGWGSLQDVFTMHGVGAQPAAQQPPAYQQQQPAHLQQAGGGYDPYAGASEAQVGGARNPFLNAGDYVIQVTHSEYKQARNGNFQIIEALVVTADRNTPADQPNLEGTTCSILFKQNDSFLSNIKELAMAAVGLNPQDPTCAIDQPTIGATLNGAQPSILGKLLYVEARATKTRAGGDFTRFNFWPCQSLGIDPQTNMPIPDEKSIPRNPPPQTMA